MSISSYWKLKKEIEEGKIKGNYLLIGENEFIKEDIITLLESKIVSEESRVFDKTKIYGDELPDNLYQRICSAPLGSKRRLVIVYRVDKIQKGAEQIKRAIESSSPLLCIVLTAEKHDKKKNKSLDWFLQNMNVLFCRAFSRKEIERWVNEFLRNRDMSISKEALNLLWEFIGADMFALNSELEKLIAFKPKGEITEKDIGKVVGEERILSIYALEKAISTKDMSRGLQALENLLLWGEEPRRLLYLLGRWLVLCISGKTKYPIGVDKAAEGLSELTETELSIKRGELEDKFALEEFIYRLINL